jgi:hypothetical protein
MSGLAVPPTEDDDDEDEETKEILVCSTDLVVLPGVVIPLGVYHLICALNGAGFCP